jgi:hypothetical protein
MKYVFFLFQLFLLYSPSWKRHNVTQKKSQIPFEILIGIEEICHDVKGRLIRLCRDRCSEGICPPPDFVILFDLA